MAEIISCPSCERKVQVPETYLGKRVQCPECKHEFLATTTGSAVQATAPPPMPAPASETPRPPDRAEEEDADDRPRRKRRRYEEEEEDDDDLDLRRRNRHLEPHRGGLILTLGIIALAGGFAICLPALVGPFAWIMGNNDLTKIRAGTMDPTGEGMTQTGRILGMITTILMILYIVFLCLLIGFVFTMEAQQGARRF